MEQQRSSSPNYKDPLAAIPLKPNSMSYESSSQLQKQVEASTPAGVQSEFRKESPQGRSSSRDPKNGSYGLAR